MCMLRTWVRPGLHAPTLLTLGMVPRTCGDTEVCLVGRHVVDAMVFPWQDHVPVLQDGDPAGQPQIRV